MILEKKLEDILRRFNEFIPGNPTTRGLIHLCGEHHFHAWTTSGRATEELRALSRTLIDFMIEIEHRRPVVAPSQRNKSIVNFQ